MINGGGNIHGGCSAYLVDVYVESTLLHVVPKAYHPAGAHLYPSVCSASLWEGMVRAVSHRLSTWCTIRLHECERQSFRQHRVVQISKFQNHS